MLIQKHFQYLIYQTFGPPQISTWTENHPFGPELGVALKTCNRDSWLWISMIIQTSWPSKRSFAVTMKLKCRLCVVLPWEPHSHMVSQNELFIFIFPICQEICSIAYCWYWIKHTRKTISQSICTRKYSVNKFSLFMLFHGFLGHDQS